MSKLDILYYPYYQPSNRWFRSYLLFFDNITTIVPKEEKISPEPYIQEITNEIPEAFRSLPPEKEDIKFDDVNLQLVENAFKIISESSKSDSLSLKINPQSLVINDENNIFLHNKKIDHQISRLLDKYQLILDMSELEESGISGTGKYSIVNKKASGIILSQIADKMGKKYHMTTMTDNIIDYNVNALKSFEKRRDSQPKSLLMSSMIKCLIPENITELNTEQYIQLREKYLDIREEFLEISTKLTMMHDLGEIENSDILEKEIKKITSDFDEKVQKLKNSNFGRQFRRWAPVSIGGLGTVFCGCFEDPIISIGVAATSIISPIVLDYVIKDDDSVFHGFQRKVGQLQDDIQFKADVRKMVNNYYY